MLALVIVSFLAGGLLGTKFPFYVLVPAILFASTAVSMAGVVHAQSIGAIALDVGTASTALQMGYLAGLFGHRVAVPS